jgi:hypothetical protein
VIVNEFRTAGLTATAAEGSSLLGAIQVAKPQTRIARPSTAAADNLTLPP